MCWDPFYYVCLCALTWYFLPQKIAQGLMSPRRVPKMELNAINDVEDMSTARRTQHELWPLDEIDPKKAKLPCCLVWTPLPVVSWLAPFIGHVGICREDGAILDFAGSNFVNVNDFAFGAVARYLQLDREKVHFHQCSQLLPLFYIFWSLCVCVSLSSSV